MRKPLFIGVALGAALGAATMSGAQTRSSKQAPAEFPPSSYTASQYVDSQGCVYIRAGIGGNVTWIPRLTRQRKHICGQQASLAAPAPQPAPAPRAEPVEEIVIAPPAPVAEPVAEPEEPTRVASLAPIKFPKAVQKPAAVVPAAPTVQATPNQAAPSQVVRTAVAAPTLEVDAKPVIVTKTAVAAPTPTVAGPSVEAVATPVPVKKRRKWFARKPAAAVAAKPVPVERVVNPDGPVASTSLPGSTRVVPRHLEASRQSIKGLKVPKGYRPVWNDDRLNPHRAEGTLAGRDQMNLIWTNTVPRRLVDKSSGQDMTAKVALVYPYTSTRKQERELGKVTLISRNGQVLKRVVKNRAVVQRAQRKATAVSSRSAVVEKPKKTSSARETISGKRYVQVATFGNPQNAQNTASKLKALGLPVRIGNLTRSGKTYRLVLAGPFARDGDAQSALKTVKGVGFADAYLRR